MRLATTAFALWFASVGCATTVHAGLANAPGLGGTRIADPRVHDVIANGQDSCGRLEPDPGPLRYRQPPCHREASPATSTALAPPSVRDDPWVQRWVEHYYSRWMCRTRQEALASGEGDVCGLP
jgi:hypothetical protein